MPRSARDDITPSRGCTAPTTANPARHGAAKIAPTDVGHAWFRVDLVGRLRGRARRWGRWTNGGTWVLNA